MKFNRKNNPIRPAALTSTFYQTFCVTGTWALSTTDKSDAARLIEQVDAAMPQMLASNEMVKTFMNRNGLEVSSHLVAEGFGDGMRFFPLMELTLIREIGGANNAYHYRKVQDVLFPWLERALGQMGRSYENKSFVLEDFAGICMSCSGASTYDEANDVCDAIRNIVDCYRDNRAEGLKQSQQLEVEA